MRILATAPGKLGDVIWALPTVRWLAETYQTTIDLYLPQSLHALLEVLLAQPYVGEVTLDSAWVTQDTAPRTPQVPPTLDSFLADRRHNAVLHLGYPDWPKLPLPYETAAHAYQQLVALGDDWATGLTTMGAIPPTQIADLSRPWITRFVRQPRHEADPPQIAVAWTDRWAELKIGLTLMLQHKTIPNSWDGDVDWVWLTEPGSRIDLEASYGALPGNATKYPVSLEKVIYFLAGSHLVLTDNSLVMTLAQGMGIHTVCMEPEADRHHPIFWPETGKLHKVIGNDGRPTFDARHTKDRLVEILDQALAERPKRKGGARG